MVTQVTRVHEKLLNLCFASYSSFQAEKAPWYYYPGLHQKRAFCGVRP